MTLNIARLCIYNIKSNSHELDYCIDNTKFLSSYYTDNAQLGINVSPN